MTWESAVLVAAALLFGGALYIRLRWRHSPQAFRAMIVLAVCYFAAGSLVGAWVFHIAAPIPKGPAIVVATPAIIPRPTLAPLINPNASTSKPYATIPPLHYDLARAIRPDRELTPGDVFPYATRDDVCTPGWSREHRHVTESERYQVYVEYGRRQGPGCCEVDHLIPLELGGTNTIKNLWPQPDDPRPGAAEKDQLENTLHRLVCAGQIPLAEAQQCIASDWVGCWKKYELSPEDQSVGTASR